MKDVFDILNQFQVSHVLDAATGRGEFINVLRQKLGAYVQIIGVDSNDKSVNYAQKFFPDNDVEIYRMELEELRFEDGYFDLVCISNSLHHLQHRDKVFAELLRVLKPGGEFLVTEMYKDGQQTEAQMTHILMHHWVASIDRKCGIHHEETFSKDEILAIIHKLKLKKLQTRDFYIPVDDPRQASNCEHLKRSCQETFKRLEGLEDPEILRSEGEAILARIEEIGCASASRLLLWGHK